MGFPELTHLPELSRLVVIGFNVAAGLTLPSVIVQRRGRPMAALAWVLVLVSMPPVGVVLWWIFGRKYLERKRIRRRLWRTRSAAQRKAARAAEQGNDLVQLPENVGSRLPILQIPREQAFGIFPPTAENSVRLLVDADGFFTAMEEVIGDARHHVHLLFYIWREDEVGRRFRDLLIAKARQGVRVRLLCDGVGSPRVRGRFMDDLRAAGGEVAVFLPPQVRLSNLTVNFRNHRKLLVADGRRAVTGSFNVGREYYGWHDVGVEFRGPVVDQLQEVFADDWFFASGENLFEPESFGGWRQERQALPERFVHRASCGVIASGPDMNGNPTHDAFFVAVTQARERIWITTPYFVPSEAMLSALRTAVYRGVEVRVLLPSRLDVPFVRYAARSYYPELLESGVRIFELAGPMLHAKTLIVDAELSIVGSANLDSRSFRLNFELNSFIESRELNAQLSALFDRWARDGVEIRTVDLAGQSYWHRFVDSVAHLLSPLL